MAQSHRCTWTTKRPASSNTIKLGRALRTAATINDTYDFDIGRALNNLPARQAIGFAANRRPLELETVSHDCAIGQDAFQRLQAPVACDNQGAATLRFGDPRVLASPQVLVLFSLQPEGFRNQHLCQPYARLLGLDPTALTAGQLTYQLQRLRLHGLIERVPGSHRYRPINFGLQAALFLSRLYARAIRPAMSLINPHALPSNHGLRAPSTTSINKSIPSAKSRNLPHENFTHSQQLLLIKASSPRNRLRPGQLN